MPPQSASQVTYDPEFPTTSKKGGGANKYNFIPTQFRTQPVNLPTPLLPRGNTLASLQDKSKYAALYVIYKWHSILVWVNVIC